MNHLLSLKDVDADWIAAVIRLARDLKANPEKYQDAMHRRVLMMIFEKPSLRTRVSFETGMAQMGGHAIYYDFSTSPLGAGKESLPDTVRTVSRYVDAIMARLFEHAKILEMAKYSEVPVINALTDYEHPCQILGDLMTIEERKGGLKGLKLAYLGDGLNNVTHSLMYGGAIMGMNVSVGCPDGAGYMPAREVVEWTRQEARRNGTALEITHDAARAVRGADVVYTDSWMSYHIPPHKLNERVQIFTPYQVNRKLMDQAKPDAIFMNCLPALREYEQTAEVLDGPQSVVFDEAENRLHIQKAVLLRLLGKA